MEEDKEILYLLDIAINSYIENDILRLDVSDTTKNRLKRDLIKKFRDEDFIYDIKNNIGLILKSKVKKAMIKDKEERYARFKYGNDNPISTGSYDYKYTDIDLNDYAGSEVQRVLQELLDS